MLPKAGEDPKEETQDKKIVQPSETQQDIRDEVHRAQDIQKGPDDKKNLPQGSDHNPPCRVVSPNSGKEGALCS